MIHLSKRISKSAFGLLAFGVTLLLIEPANLPESFLTEASARVGRPLTPVSVGGVARRTTRRSIYATTAVTAAAVTPTVVTQPVTVVEQPVTVVQQSALPVGSTVPSLPSGCSSTTVNNTSYFTCGGNWYKPAMQGGNVIYTVVANPG